MDDNLIAAVNEWRRCFLASEEAWHMPMTCREDAERMQAIFRNLGAAEMRLLEATNQGATQVELDIIERRRQRFAAALSNNR